MTSFRLQERKRQESRWASRCHHRDCDRELRVSAESWQTKIEVLSALRDHPARKRGHLHGRITVNGYNERGGE